MADQGTQRSSTLPRGTLLVGAGLAVLGASSYVFLTVSARALGPAAFANISVLYVLVFTVGPGLFLPVEQELARAVAHLRAQGRGAWTVVLRVTRTSGLAVAVLLAATVALSPLVVPRLFDGSWQLVVDLVAATVALWAAYLSRGVLAGLGHFNRYGAQLALEGLSRTLGVVVVAAVGLHGSGPYAALLPIPIAISLLGTGRGIRTGLGEGGPAVGLAETTSTLAWLLVASTASQLLVNLGPVLTKLVSSPQEKAAAGQFLAGLVLARLPLFAFAAVQAALLPGLAAQLAAGRVDDFVAGLRRLVLAALALGAITVVVVAVAGPALVHLFFGSAFDLSRVVLVELAAGSGLYILCVILGQALIALRRYAASGICWVIGLAGFGLTAVLGTDVVSRVAVGFLAGVVVSLAAFVVLLRPAIAGARSTHAPLAASGAA